MIDAKWVYTWKVDEHGWVVNAKSKLVARGFKQREGVDFSETFAPTVSSSCVRLLSAIACECDSDLCHFDGDQAFVLSDLDDIFLRTIAERMWWSFRKGRSAQQKFVWIEAGIAYLACSPDMSQKTRFRATHDRCTCFPFD